MSWEKIDVREFPGNNLVDKDLLVRRVVKKYYKCHDKLHAAYYRAFNQGSQAWIVSIPPGKAEEYHQGLSGRNRIVIEKWVDDKPIKGGKHADGK